MRIRLPLIFSCVALSACSYIPFIGDDGSDDVVDVGPPSSERNVDYWCHQNAANGWDCSTQSGIHSRSANEADVEPETSSEASVSEPHTATSESMETQVGEVGSTNAEPAALEVAEDMAAAENVAVEEVVEEAVVEEAAVEEAAAEEAHPIEPVSPSSEDENPESTAEIETSGEGGPDQVQPAVAAPETLKLEEVPEYYYAVQLLAAIHRGQAEVFIENTGLAGAEVVPTTTDSGDWFVVIAGYYTDRATARYEVEQKAGLDVAETAWIRPVSELRVAYQRWMSQIPAQE